MLQIEQNRSSPVIESKATFPLSHVGRDEQEEAAKLGAEDHTLGSGYPAGVKTQRKYAVRRRPKNTFPVTKHIANENVECTHRT
jgi:hypothetical protein